MHVVTDGRCLIGGSSKRLIRLRYAKPLAERLPALIDLRRWTGYYGQHERLTQILDQIQQGDLRAAADLLPLVYAELRRLAAAQLAREKPGQTLDATALVHEAYLRLVGPADEERWQNRGHFYAAAAEAMRHILVALALRKGGMKREA
jgi:ECF sigma factor